MNFKHFKRFNLLVLFCAVIVSGCASGQKAVDITLIQPPSKQSINSVIANLSKQIVSNMLKQKKSKVAVTNFLTVEGHKTKLGLFLSDKVTNSLFKFRDKFEVVERRRMEALQEEILLGFSGVIDDDTAQDLGKATGADAIVIGTITDLGDEVDISLRMLGTERANVIAVASASLEKNDAVAKLMVAVADKILIKPQPGAPKNPGKTDPGVPNTEKKPPKDIERSVEMEGFLFQLQECKLSGSNVKCSMLITNNKKDRGLVLVSDGWGPNNTSNILDYTGNEYLVETVQLGNNSSRGGDVRKTLYRGIPLKASFSSTGVSPQLNRIALIHLNFYRFTVQFRDVPLVK